MITAEMQALIDAPLADPNKLFIPNGEKRVIRRSRPQYHCEKLPKLTRAQVEDRKVETYSRKITALLDYYATTTIPFDRIAEHTGLKLDKVIEAMTRRGRAA